MEVRAVHDPRRFLDETAPLLLEDEARHNLVLGIAGTLASAPDVYPEFILWVVHDGDRVVGAAVRTPPYNLVLARPRAESVIDAVAESLHAEGRELPGVVGSLPESEEF